MLDESDPDAHLKQRIEIQSGLLQSERIPDLPLRRTLLSPDSSIACKVSLTSNVDLLLN